MHPTNNFVKSTANPESSRSESPPPPSHRKNCQFYFILSFLQQSSKFRKTLDHEFLVIVEKEICDYMMHSAQTFIRQVDRRDFTWSLSWILSGD